MKRLIMGLAVVLICFVAVSAAQADPAPQMKAKKEGPKAPGLDSSPSRPTAVSRSDGPTLYDTSREEDTPRAGKLKGKEHEDDDLEFMGAAKRWKDAKSLKARLRNHHRFAKWWWYYVKMYNKRPFRVIPASL